MIYVIDHNDSFTHNVVHQFSLFDEVHCDNYNQINKNKIYKKNINKDFSNGIILHGGGWKKMENLKVNSKDFKMKITIKENSTIESIIFQEQRGILSKRLKQSLINLKKPSPLLHNFFLVKISYLLLCPYFNIGITI